MTSTSYKNIFRKTLIVIVWLALWQIVSLLVNNSVLLAGPIETIKSLAELIRTSAFWKSVSMSTLFICGGFFIGIICGTCLAIISSRSSLAEEFLSPVIGLLKSIPVASFVVLVLVWFGNKYLSCIISALVVTPIIYLNIREGLKTVDAKLLEMGKVFSLPFSKVIRLIYIPALKPFILSSFSLASGMAWKSGIAAELIGQPLSTLGNGLYRSKIFLMTADMFAWTVVAILMAYLFEKLVVFLVRRICK